MSKSEPKLEDQWPEIISILLMVLGFTLAVLLRNSFLIYITVIFAGYISGKYYYVKRSSQPIFPFVMIIAGFFIGFFIGGLKANNILILVLFLGSMFASYKLYQKNIFKTFKNDQFVK